MQRPNVVNGKDKPHVPKGKENEHGVHYAFAVSLELRRGQTRLLRMEAQK